MIALKHLNKRQEKIIIPKQLLEILPPQFEVFIYDFELNPIFNPQTVLIENTNEKIHFTFSLDKSKNDFLNNDGDEYLSFNSLEELVNNIGIESDWNKNNLIAIGSTYVSQIYIGYGASNFDSVYVDVHYENNYTKVAHSIFDFFDKLYVEFRPVINNVELDQVTLKKSKTNPNQWTYNKSD